MSSTLAFGIHREPEPLGDLTHAVVGLAEVEQCPAWVGSAPSTMFSATVITGISMKCWCTIPTPASIAALGEPSCTGLPAMRISPSSGW